MAAAARACVSLILPAPMRPMNMKLSQKSKVKSQKSKVKVKRGSGLQGQGQGSNMKSDYILEVFPADKRRLLGRACFVGYGVELDDGPALKLDITESGEHTLQVYLASPELHETVRPRQIPSRRGDRTLEILDVYETQAIGVLPDRAHGISSALLIVRGIEQELHVPRVGCLEDLGNRFRGFADRVHVMMIGERDAEVRRALTELGHQTSEAHVVARDDRPILRTRVDYLKIQP